MVWEAPDLKCWHLLLAELAAPVAHCGFGDDIRLAEKDIAAELAAQFSEEHGHRMYALLDALLSAMAAVLLRPLGVVPEEAFERLAAYLENMVDMETFILLDQHIVQHHADIAEFRLRIRNKRGEHLPIIYADIVMEPGEPGDQTIAVLDDDEVTCVNLAVRCDELVAIESVAILYAPVVVRWMQLNNAVQNPSCRVLIAPKI